MLQRSPTQTLTEQLAERFAARIRDRLLAPGTRLPSVRQCAAQQGVSPSTVVAAYDRLLAQGLIEARAQRGFFVRDLAPKRPPASARKAQAAIDSIASLDAWLAQELQPACLVTKPFVPLPVLGIPGWWPGNENFSFYDDSLVFRSAPRKSNYTMGSAAL